MDDLPDRYLEPPDDFFSDRTKEEELAWADYKHDHELDEWLLGSEI